MGDVVAYEVVRRGRFSWDVVVRREGLLFDTCLEVPYMFRWSAVRRARRDAARQAGPGNVVVARFEARRPS